VDTQTFLKAGIILAVLTLGTSIVFFKPLRATWQANIGAVEMSRQQLANWPTGEWETADDTQRYAQTADKFESALNINPENRTANHRLGLILMGQQHFQDAAAHLERAYATSPSHRGVRKSLGYCYTWLGEFEQAEAILREIPEARQEMGTYIWWWKTQGRDDLSEKAGTMAARLSSTSQIQTEK
jgi:tetratricopeptide (TPR) repeat protein